MAHNKFESEWSVRLIGSWTNPFTDKRFVVLQHLDLSHNSLRKLAFDNELPLLTTLDLSHNLLDCVTGLKNIQFLSRLAVHNNRFSGLGAEFSALQKLEDLDASYNLISQYLLRYLCFSIDFGRLKSLKRIALSNNKIADLHFLNGHGQLEEAKVDSNLVSRIPEMYGLISLQHLSLKYG